MVIREKVTAVEDGMKSEEVIARLTIIARLMDTAEAERADIFDFIRFIEPNGDVGGQAGDLEGHSWHPLVDAVGHDGFNPLDRGTQSD